MTTLYFALVALILIAGVSLLFRQAHYRSLPDAALRNMSRPDLLERLNPFGSVCDEEKVWEAIGGKQGVREIRRSLRAIRERVARLARENPACSPDSTAMFVSAAIGCGLAIRALVEAKMHEMYKDTPRIYACALARHYVHMAARVDALESRHSYLMQPGAYPRANIYN